jgi:ABC-type antimicrobial peptide transport system permease subunit
MVVGRGLALTLAGVALGLLAGVSAADAIEGLLYGVGSLDPVSLAGSCLLLVAVAVAASWVPAARAARLDPVTVLRRE